MDNLVPRRSVPSLERSPRLGAVIGVAFAVFAFPVLLGYSFSTAGFDLAMLGSGSELIRYLWGSVLFFGLLLGLFARRPMGRLSFVAITMGSLVALGFMRLGLTAVSSPKGTTLLPTWLVPGFVEGYARSARQGEANLVLLRRGIKAAEAGHPLSAPEGGSLIPMSVKDPEGGTWPLRYPSSHQTLPEITDAWRKALRKTAPLVADSNAWAQTKPTSSGTPWVLAWGTVLLASLGYGTVVNGTAVASGKILGRGR